MAKKAKTVRIACSGARLVELDALVELQGDLKFLSDENFQRLRGEIVRSGFSEPFAIWINRGKCYLLNGTQRRRVLVRMREEGWTVPSLPAVTVRAKDEREARRTLLAMASQYGQIRRKGLAAFAKESGIELAEMQERFNFPEVAAEALREIIGADEETPDVVFSEEILESQNYIVLTFSNEVDWMAALTHFDLETRWSKRRNGKPWSKGIGRVLDGAKYLERIGEA